MKKLSAILIAIVFGLPLTASAADYECAKSRRILYPRTNKSGVILYPCPEKTRKKRSPAPVRVASAYCRDVTRPSPSAVTRVCPKKRTSAISIRKTRKAKSISEGACIEEIRRSSVEKSRMAEQLGRLRERDRANQAWFREYEKWYYSRKELSTWR